MLDDYLNQTAEWRPFEQANEYNEPQYGAPVEIICRKVHKTQYVRSEKLEQLLSTMTCYTRSPVNEKDLLDGKTVLTVEDWVELEGTILGYKVMT